MITEAGSNAVAPGITVVLNQFEEVTAQVPVP